MVAIIIIAILVALDQYTKHLALVDLQPVESIVIIKNVFSLTYVQNDGAAWNILSGQIYFFIVLTTVILILLFFYYKSLPKEKPYIYVKWALVLVSAGAIGNLIDRITNKFVVDFLHVTFINFPVFNFADCFVCVGAFSLAILYIFIIKD